MGLFDDAGIDADELATGVLDPGDHKAVLTAISLETYPKYGRDDYDVPNYVLEYSVENFDFALKEFFPVLPDGVTFANLDDEDDTFNVFTARGRTVNQTERKWWSSNYASLKRRLVSLGVEESRVNSVALDDLVGTEVVLTTDLNKKGFARITKVSVPGASGVKLPTPAKPVANKSAEKVNDAPKSNPFKRS